MLLDLIIWPALALAMALYVFTAVSLSHKAGPAREHKGPFCA